MALQDGNVNLLPSSIPSIITILVISVDIISNKSCYSCLSPEQTGLIIEQNKADVKLSFKGIKSAIQLKSCKILDMKGDLHFYK